MTDLTDLRDKKLALISVFDKTGLETRAARLLRLDFTLVSSRGTYQYLADHGLPVVDLGNIVGPPILDHLVATLSREVHAGLLANYEEHLSEMEELGFPYIPFVGYGLYELEKAIAEPGATVQSVRQATDMGGIAGIRSGAKGGRIVVCEDSQWEPVLDWMEAGMPDEEEFRLKLAARAEFVSAGYCGASAEFLSGWRYRVRTSEVVRQLKYGENAHQAPAYLLKRDDSDPLAIHRFEEIGGTAPSLINITDSDQLVNIMTRLAAVYAHNYDDVPNLAIVVKHGTPCGAGVGDTPEEAIQRMVAGNPEASFGGFVMTNFPVNGMHAKLLKFDPAQQFDGLLAPEIDDSAVKVLERWQGKCRMMVNPALGELDERSVYAGDRFREVRGGAVVQPASQFLMDLDKLEVMAGDPTDDQMEALLLAWAVGSSSYSNTITIARDRTLLVNGVGQQARHFAVKLSLMLAEMIGHDVAGASVYSDSFFLKHDAPTFLLEQQVGLVFSTYTEGSKRTAERDEAVRQLFRDFGPDDYQPALVQLPDSVARGFAMH